MRQVGLAIGARVPVTIFTSSARPAENSASFLTPHIYASCVTWFSSSSGYGEAVKKVLRSMERTYREANTRPL